MAAKTRRTRKSVKKAPRALSPSQVAKAVVRLGVPTGTDRFAAGKALMVTAEKDPARVYPHFDALAARLDGKCKIVRWNVLRTLASLAPVDRAGKIDAILPRMLAYIRGPSMITAANTIGGVTAIARARPDLLAQIVTAVLGVETAVYETAECRNVAIGHALDAVKALEAQVQGDAAVRDFVRRQVGNTRPAAARRAAELVKRWGLAGGER